MFGDRLGYYNTEMRPFTLADRIFSGRLSNMQVMYIVIVIVYSYKHCKILQILILQTIAAN